MGQRRYQANGFVPVGSPPGRITRLADTDSIIKGDIVEDNGSGLATNADNVLFTARMLGVAAADCDNTGDEDLSVEIYPLDFDTLYIVPVTGATAITADAVGTYVDLETNDEVDITDEVTEGLAFFIEDYDASTEAVAANTAGYAIGRFRNLTTQNS